MITLEALQFLASSSGESLLNRLAADDLSEANTLRLLTTLRKDYIPENAGAALELARLRLKAVGKFGDDAPCMFFTRDALEQASDPLIRQWRAGQTRSGMALIDACCSIGSDALAFAQVGAIVTGLDIDPARIQMARLNARALGIYASFETADVREGMLRSEMIFFDPGRREGEKRIHQVEAYQPPLKTLKGWDAERIIVKLSPGVDLGQLEAYGGETAFVSVDGDLKEAQLTLIRGQSIASRRAVLLLPNKMMEWRQGEDIAQSRLSEPLQYIIEPDPALIRAGLVTDAAIEWGAYQLDETIAYLTANDAPQSEWARAWCVQEWMPFNVKRLREVLRARGIGQVTVKKRGTAVTPEALMAQLKLKGNNKAVLILTRLQGTQIVLLCEEP